MNKKSQISKEQAEAFYLKYGRMPRNYVPQELKLTNERALASYRVQTQKWEPGQERDYNYPGSYEAKSDTAILRKEGALSEIPKTKTREDSLALKRAEISTERQMREERFRKGIATSQDTTYFRKQAELGDIINPPKPAKPISTMEKGTGFAKEVMDAIEGIKKRYKLPPESNYEDILDEIKIGTIDVKEPLTQRFLKNIEAYTDSLKTNFQNELYYEIISDQKEKILRDYGLTEEDYQLLLEEIGNK